MKKIPLILSAILTAALFTSCYSIYSGGTGGVIVDAESTNTPKSGIANVDVYAYTTQASRDADFSAWTEGTIFEPQAEYYGHTTTGVDGSFVISKLVWKTKFNESSFGKDADTSLVYLLFFHNDYGLTKGDTLIVSDSTSDTVYAELTSVRKSTNVTINLVDVTSGNQTATPMYVQVTVPQTTTANTTASAITYDQIITGTGTVRITYPRWQSPEDRTAGKETTPTVKISYFQSAEQISMAGCYNEDNEDKNFAFREDAVTGINKIIKNRAYELTLYVKPTKLRMPSISGQYKNAGDVSDDGLVVSLMRKDSEGNYTIDCGQVSTQVQAVGSSGNEKHGMFSGLGGGENWTDTTYTGKYAEAQIQILVDGTAKKEMTVRSDVGSYTVQL